MAVDGDNAGIVEIAVDGAAEGDGDGAGRGVGDAASGCRSSVPPLVTENARRIGETLPGDEGAVHCDAGAGGVGDGPGRPQLPA